MYTNFKGCQQCKKKNMCENSKRYYNNNIDGGGGGVPWVRD